MNDISFGLRRYDNNSVLLPEEEAVEENVTVMERSPRRIIKKTAKALAMQPVSPSTSIASDHSTSGRRTRRTESPVCINAINAVNFYCHSSE